MVPVDSALAFGTPLPDWPVDHLRQMNWMERDELHRPLAPPIDLYAHLLAHLASLGFGTEPIPAHSTKNAPAWNTEEVGPSGVEHPKETIESKVSCNGELITQFPLPLARGHCIE